MKEFEMRNVGSHIEVYTAGGVFIIALIPLTQQGIFYNKNRFFTHFCRFRLFLCGSFSVILHAFYNLPFQTVH